jgi:hypothetical protein
MLKFVKEDSLYFLSGYATKHVGGPYAFHEYFVRSVRVDDHNELIIKVVSRHRDYDDGPEESTTSYCY